jgi:hypothetical protein
VSSDPSSWREYKAPVAPGPIWSFTRGYRVNEAGRHENEEQFRAFQFYLNSGGSRTLESTASFCDKGPQTISDWSKKYNWDRRCAAYDKKQMAITFKEANKIERQNQRRAIQEFRDANEEQARQMMEVSSDLMTIIQARIQKAAAEGEDIPMGLVSGLMRAAANISDSGRQSWATALGVGQLMEVVDQELEEVQVEILNEEEEDEAYQIPLDEN